MEGILMTRHRLTDDQREPIKDVFPPPAKTGRPPSDRRMIVDGILWILRASAPWRDLPEEYGPWGLGVGATGDWVACDE